MGTRSPSTAARVRPHRSERRASTAPARAVPVTRPWRGCGAPVAWRRGRVAQEGIQRDETGGGKGDLDFSVRRRAPTQRSFSVGCDTRQPRQQGVKGEDPVFGVESGDDRIERDRRRSAVRQRDREGALRTGYRIHGAVHEQGTGEFGLRRCLSELSEIHSFEVHQKAVPSHLAGGQPDATARPNVADLATQVSIHPHAVHRS